MQFFVKFIAYFLVLLLLHDEGEDKRYDIKKYIIQIRTKPKLKQPCVTFISEWNMRRDSDRNIRHVLLTRLYSWKLHVDYHH